MKFKLIYASWNDLWVGAFVEPAMRRVYVIVLGFGFEITWSKR